METLTTAMIHLDDTAGSSKGSNQEVGFLPAYFFKASYLLMLFFGIDLFDDEHASRRGHVGYLYDVFGSFGVAESQLWKAKYFKVVSVE
jgi:hypothetical protein